MREILFRGRRIDNGAWVEGMYLSQYHSSVFGRIDVIFYSDECKTHRLPVDAATVGQFTGLIDKNGKKILEGDILRGFVYPYLSDGHHNYNAEVVWFDDCPAFGLLTLLAPGAEVHGISTGNTDLIEDDLSDWEIIGNVHDNPKLAGEEREDADCKGCSQ